MQKTGRNIQTIAIIVTIVIIIIILIAAGTLAGKLSSRLTSTIWTSALFLGLGQLINGILLYGVGKIIEGIGYMTHDINNMSNIRSQGKKESKINEASEEKLPDL